MVPLVHRLLSTARSTPEAVAIVDGGRRWRYAELADAVRRFAGLLRARGLGDAERVAIVLPNRFEAVVACYGAWLAGCIAVPLNPQASSRELATWLAHCRPRLVVLEAGDAAAVAVPDAAPGAGWLRVGGAGAGDPADEAWEHAMPAAAPLSGTCITQPLAAILYTSGTTGAPKGVTLGHANFAANVDAIVDYLALDAGDSIVSVLPFHYAYGASVLHTHLAVGARLVIEPNLVFPHAVVDTLARERATGFSGVPSTFALLLDRAVLDGHALPHLRYITQAGGPMPPPLAARLRAALPGTRLFVMYGQTEATARLAWMPPERLDDRPGSVGRAIAGVRLQVRDATGAPLPAGYEGEIWARGGGIMAGYWNDPLATAAVLRDGWLRTGDLGWMDPEGFLFIAGRRSDMIKTGAHRVHPQEVEEALREMDGVLEAAVAGIGDATLGQVVKAWVVAAGGLDANAVRAHCRERLAPYKVPRQVEFVTRLPRTASGKVRRAALALQEAP
ncbi:AMP-binding protein [Lysobacter sp. GX 14042]|uniref:class I adenylate-forming enzyme family protein n=1 Tax=Lysobacter sp. GX 14042 TaxID=2907155 RepID=UPI001F3CC958|nr:AMP-binding protein [Lysobacter sp. GX 14042]MCE7032670.1 AMP-binding protein [Lysobacter sp. GX 14042]